MIAIRREIAEVEAGKMRAEDSVLHHAPHTHHLLMADWDRPYSKEQAFFPLNGEQADKYWPPVGRVDNVAGDRPLLSTCPPVESSDERRVGKECVSTFRSRVSPYHSKPTTTPH